VIGGAVKVYWTEQTAADVPLDDAWLSAAECARLNAMRIAKRRADWRLGRWTAKSAVARYLRLNAPQHFRRIELLPAPSGAPKVFLAGQPASVTVSLSHRAGTAICAVAEPGVALGCDLELIEPHSDAFIADFFTAEEQALLARTGAAERDRLVALFWSAKESALKAVGAGLRLDTRTVAVHPTDSLMYASGTRIWRPLHVRFRGGQFAEGWWQDDGNLLRTLVSAPPPAAPVLPAPTLVARFAEQTSRV
jgi:4'-phosphopantetheinyl transferase